MSLLFVHQIAKYISKDNCGLHEPLAGSQARVITEVARKRSYLTSSIALKTGE